jgi:CarD family transcriptional regulator
VAKVAAELLYIDRERGLSTGERKMLDQVKQILISELLLAGGTTDEDQLEKMFDSLSKKTSL